MLNYSLKPTIKVCLISLHSSNRLLISNIPTPFSLWSSLTMYAIYSKSSSNYLPLISSFKRVSKTSFMIIWAFSDGVEEVLLSSSYFFSYILIFSISFFHSSSSLSLSGGIISSRWYAYYLLKSVSWSILRIVPSLY